MFTEATRVLIIKIASGIYTDAELAEFLDAVKAMDKSTFREAYQLLYEEVNKYPPERLSPGFKDQLERRLDALEAEKDFLPGSMVPVTKEDGPVPVKGKWWRYAAAAAVVVFALMGAYLVANRTSEESIATASPYKEDVSAPAVVRATITLANGKKIYLDSAGTGTLAMQGTTRVVRGEDGKLSYEEAGSGAMDPNALNTLNNPRGSRVISLTLSDGTRVWLNTESTLTYPVVFNGKERRVTISGEAYFEVSPNADKPFLVTRGNDEVTVLGTHFNFRAYGDEEEVKVALLEGSVKVSELSTRDSKIISPGEQVSVAQHTSAPELKVRENVDLDIVTAWKNGIFHFDQEGITDIMLQLGRWYDVDVIYEGNKSPDLFTGIIKRNNNISQVLKLLEQTNRVHFKIEGGKIIVMK
jgi:ferric-dicitrate binding protein FerR (iron transport regulator)